jgi:membrane protease YdiL (CAAX protease family)
MDAGRDRCRSCCLPCRGAVPADPVGVFGCAVSSVLFGLWHILPSLHLALTNRGVGAAVRGVGGSATVLVVVATVVVIAIGGAVNWAALQFA